MKKTTEKYSPEDAYNADETRLLYRLMPKKKKKMLFKGDKCKGAKKKSKERLTVLLCSNSTGADKLKLLVIRKYENPRCIKSLLFDYTANKNA